MISRIGDTGGIDNYSLDNVKKIIDKQNSTLKTVSSLKEAEIIKKEMNLKGQNVEIEKCINGFKILSKKQERIDLREASKSGMFKKLAWGRYCFTKESRLGDTSYDFDDGSIWKVIKDENGSEFLVKELDASDELVRTNIKNYIDKDNYEKFAIALNIENGDNSLVSMMVNNNMEKEASKMLDTKIDKEIYSILNGSVRLASNKELKELIINHINGDIIKSYSDMKNLINQDVNKKNNFSVF